MATINEKVLIRIIKYAPSVFTLLLTLIISIFIYDEHLSNIEFEKKLIEKTKIEEEKKETKDWVDSIHKSLVNLKSDTEYNLRKDIRNEVNNAYAIAYKIFNKYKNEKTKEEIVDLIKTALRPIRFNEGRGYLFIYDKKSKNILNAGFPELEGKSLWNYKDSKGTLLFQEVNKILNKKSETFYEWYWHKEDDKVNEYRKVGFLKKFEPYEWFIGTGEYVSDFEESLRYKILEYIKKIRFKNDRYIFMTDKKGVILSTKYVNLYGKNLKDENPSISKFYSKDYIEDFAKGKFVNYNLTQFITNKKELKKIFYVRWIKDWQWVIGTGFDLNVINDSIIKRQEQLEQKYNKYLQKAIFLFSIIILLLLIVSHIISSFLEKSFYKYKSKLQEQNKTLITAQKTARIGDWKLDLDKMEAYWSEEIFDILGIENIPKSVGPEYLKSIMHKEDWPKFEKSINNAMENKALHSCVYRVISPRDGQVVWIDCNGQIAEDGSRIIGTVQDITNRIKLEEEKEQKETLLYQQSKMASMGEMLANIAHQWRQPLSVITTSATGLKLQQEMGILDEKELNTNLEHINETAQHLSRTIEDFRSFFKPKDNKVSEFKVQDIFVRTLNLVNAQFKSKNIKIIENIDDIRISSLENELVQALINILNNARDALSISNKTFDNLIIIKAYEKNNKLIIEIKDNAGGIDEKIIDRVFEPYFTTKHQSHGTGIGLYMTQQIIEKLLSGKIVVQNKYFFYEGVEYKGANFEITLPLDNLNKNINS